MKKTLIFFREGATDANKAGLIQGTSIILPLNDTGIEQAKSLGISLKDIPIDICFTSPLPRSKQTAEIALAGRNIEIIEEQGLTSAQFGIMEGKPIASLSAEDEIKWRSPNPDFRFPGGESQQEVADRIEKTLIKIANITNHKNIAICTHGANTSWFRYCNPHLAPRPGDTPHATAILFEIEDGKITLK